jgi:hypothetical protein
MRKLLLILFLVGFSNLYSQNLVQTFVDRCTGETKIFTVPMNGQSTVVFYNKSRTFTAQQFQNGELQAWLEETYLWWASLNPCSTAATNVVTTQAATQQTTQQATDAAAAATAAAAAAAAPPPVPASPPPVATPPTQTATTGTTGTTNPPTNDTSTQNTTGSTQSTGSTDTGGSTSNTDSSSTGSTQSDSTGDTGGSTEGGTSDSSSNDGGSSTEETKTEETKTEETKSEEKTEEVKEEKKEETKEESKEESKEEESKEESKEEESKEEEEKKKEEEEKKEEEKKKKKKKEQQLGPPIVTANMAMMQGVDGTYSYASTFGVSRSSLMGDKTYGLNTMIWSNLQQFMLNANFTKIHINKEGRASRVYSASIGGAKMFTTVMGNMNHSWVFLGKKGSVAGVALGTSITSLDLNVVNGLVYYDENILSQSATVFYTKPIPYDRYTISPMLAVSSPFVSLETFSRRTTWSTDVMFIGGVSGTFNITKRFGANLGINAVTSTLPNFPVLINYTIGSRFSF